MANILRLEEMLTSEDDNSLSDSSSSSDEEYEDAVLVMNAVDCRCYYRYRVPRVQNYIETVMHQYNNVDFQQQFRLTRGKFEYLLNIIAPLLQGEDAEVGNVVTLPEKQFLFALWYFATPDSYRSIIQMFDMGSAAAHRAVDRGIKALYFYRNFFITWVANEERIRTAQRIEQVSGYPGVYGFGDGFHTRIIKPGRDGVSYINRKRYPSIQTQVLCKTNLAFFHVFSGFPGSVHDSRVFTYSGVQQRLNNSEPGTYILADSAYSLQEHVMVPYRDDGALTLEEVHYNRIAATLRQTVKRSIGLLKIRWRILLDKCPLKRIRMIPYLIVACCVLHNVCLLRDDQEWQIPGAPPIVTPYPGPLEPDAYSRQQGIAERERITMQLNNM